MATGEDSRQNFFPMMSSTMMQRTRKKPPSHITKRKNLQRTHFRFGGNRKDPLNLNALIEKKKQATQSANNTNNNDHTDNGNDRPVEILLQPDIFDPLRLDTSSRNDEDLNNLYSIPSNSTNKAYEQQTKRYPTRNNRYMKKRRQLPPARYGNFPGYYGYRQPNHDQRLRYLEHDWFQNKQVLDVGCHTGHVTFYVAEHFQPSEIVGVDIDRHLIEQARHQLWNRIQTANNTQQQHQQINPNDPTRRFPYNLRFEQGY